MPEDEIVQIARRMIQALVDDPQAVEVHSHNGHSATLLIARVGHGQAGQLIGKHGKNLLAVRTLLTAIGAKGNRRVHLEFNDDVA